MKWDISALKMNCLGRGKIVNLCFCLCFLPCDLETPESFVPEDIASGSTDMRRTWLHAKSAEVVYKFILLGNVVEAVTGLGEASVTLTQATQYPCRAPGCQQVYTYVKARDNHELKKHNLHVFPKHCLVLQHSETTNRNIHWHVSASAFSFWTCWMLLKKVMENDWWGCTKPMRTATRTVRFSWHFRWMRIWPLAPNYLYLAHFFCVYCCILTCTYLNSTEPVSPCPVTLKQTVKTFCHLSMFFPLCFLYLQYLITDYHFTILNILPFFVIVFDYWFPFYNPGYRI